MSKQKPGRGVNRSVTPAIFISFFMLPGLVHGANAADQTPADGLMQCEMVSVVASLMPEQTRRMTRLQDGRFHLAQMSCGTFCRGEEYNVSCEAGKACDCSCSRKPVCSCK